MATSSDNLYFFSFLLWLIITEVCPWKAREFPNPNRNVNSCGRGGIKSWVCDPDSVLKKTEADTLEELLMGINLETDSGCESSFEEKRGFEIGVAVLKNMDTEDGESDEKTAREFARHLHDVWGVGKKSCNDGALIFLAVNDRQLYISTGRKTKERLTDEQIDLVIEKIRPLLREKDYGRALEQCLGQVKDILEGRPLESSYSSLAVVIFWLIFSLGVGCIIKSFYNQKKYKDFERKLSRIDNERKNPKEYKVLVCPICLEDFTPQVKAKLLMCGHKYCGPCLSEWLKNKTSCPICRQNMNRNPGINRDAGGAFSDNLVELQYRLSSLHSQYPNFVTRHTISHWLSPDFHGTFVDDVQQRNTRVLSRSYDGSLGNSSNFSGGTSRGGGGSGGNW